MLQVIWSFKNGNNSNKKEHAYALTSADRELYPLCLLKVWLNLRYIVISSVSESNIILILFYSI